MGYVPHKPPPIYGTGHREFYVPDPIDSRGSWKSSLLVTIKILVCVVWAVFVVFIFRSVGWL